MHHSFYLISLVAAAATPRNKFLSFDLTKHTNSSRTSQYKRDDGFEDTIDNAGAVYALDLSFGSQLSSHTAVIDTGSADLWVTENIFDPSQSTSFTNLTQDFSICYVDGTCVNGYFGKDTIQVGGYNVSQAQFAVVDRSEAGSLVGLGYKTTETVCGWDSDHNSIDTYDNFPYALKNSGLIDVAAYSIWLNAASASTGNIIFGGIDTSKYQGTLQKVPSVIYEIDRNGEWFMPDEPTDITVVCNGVSFKTADGDTVDVVTNAGLGALLDTGTTSTSLPKDWLIALGAGVGAEWDDNIDGMATTSIITEGSIVFDFSGITIEFPLSTAWEKAYHNGELYTINGTQAYWLAIATADEGVSATSNVIFGDKFLHNAYVVIDLDSREIAIAQAETSPGDENIVAIDTNGIPSATQAPRYSSSTLFTSYDLTTPTLIGTPTTPAS